MAVGKARYMGEPVVAVVAATRDLARDAADLVEVEYEPLDVNVDAPAARATPDAPVLHDDAGTNLVWEGSFDWGDVDGALAAADRVVRIDELHFHRFSSTPIECCGAVAEYERAPASSRCYCNHQFPGMALVFMAPALRVGIGPDPLRHPRHRRRVRQQGDHAHVPPDLLPARPQARPSGALDRVADRATTWRTRTATSAGSSDIEVAVQNDGTVLGYRMKAIDDCGAYPRYEPIGCVVWSQVRDRLLPDPERPGRLRAGVHEQVAVRAEPRLLAPASTSGSSSAWSTSSAHELGIDPVEMRKRNYVRADEMPYTTVNGCVYDSGDYARCLDLALELVDYEAGPRARSGSEPGGKLIGIGIGSTLDSGTNNFAPGAARQSAAARSRATTRRRR